MPSPLQERDPVFEEDLFDQRCLEDNAGASDSEEEPSDDDGPIPSLEDQAYSDDVKQAMEQTDFVAVKVEDG